VTQIASPELLGDKIGGKREGGANSATVLERSMESVAYAMCFILSATWTGNAATDGLMLDQGWWRLASEDAICGS